jgi:CRP-like cAMP-binding protein
MGKTMIQPESDVQTEDMDDQVPLAERVGMLAQQRLLTGVPLPVVTGFAERMQEERFEPGTSFIREGETGDRLYLIASGTAVATTGKPESPVTLAEVGAGGMMGELALITHDRHRHATVTAQTPVVALSLSYDACAEILRQFPKAQRILSNRKRNKLLVKFLQVNVLYRISFQDPRRERMFLSSLSFFMTFAGVRGIVRAIRSGKGPFRDVSTGGVHIHHLVWGILLLLLVSYGWLLQFGTGLDERRRWMRSTAMMYGVGSALTLDEFALWLHLEDVYNTPEGRKSVDAVILFGSILSAGVWGQPFFRALAKYLLSGKEQTVEV